MYVSVVLVTIADCFALSMMLADAIDDLLNTKTE